MAHLWTLPDNKIVEDIHQPLRLNARGNSNRRLSFQNIHDTVLGSGVLEKRDIRHICAVDKTTWVRRFKSTKKKNTAWAHRSCSHKLPPSWSHTMKPRKDWHTLNEETLQRAAAAWVWLHTYIEGRGSSLPHCEK